MKEITVKELREKKLEDKYCLKIQQHECHGCPFLGYDLACVLKYGDDLEWSAELTYEDEKKLFWTFEQPFRMMNNPKRAE